MGELVRLNQPTADWKVIDWQQLAITTSASTATQTNPGVVTVQTDPVPQPYWWWIDRVQVSATPAASTASSSSTRAQLTVAIGRFDLYLDRVSNDRRLDWTADGAGDYVDYPSPLWVPPGRSLIGVWQVNPVNLLGGVIYELDLTYRLVTR